MRLAQISDLHIKPAGMLAYDSVDTAMFLSRAVDRLNALGDQIDAVLATGDLVDGGRPDEYRHLRQHLDRLTKPYYVMVGNHDARKPLREAFSDHAYLRDADPFVQYAIDIGDLRVIALDSLVEGESGGKLCDTRLAWLDQQLALAHDRPVIVALHHPPFDTGIAEMDTIGLERDSAHAFERVIARYPNVERILAGHVHRSILRRFGGSVVLTCPSTAHQVALDLRKDAPLAFVLEPPGFAIHDWRPEHGLVTHYAYTLEYGKPQAF